MVSTSLLLPFELYEVIEQVSMLRVGVLLLNLVIVFYLEEAKGSGMFFMSCPRVFHDASFVSRRMPEIVHVS